MCREQICKSLVLENDFRPGKSPALSLVARAVTASVVGISLGLNASVSLAGTILVNDTGDTGLSCTLRDAVQSVNNGVLEDGCNLHGAVPNLGTDDTILFSQAVFTSPGTMVSLTQGQLELSKNVAIDATSVGGINLDAGLNSRVLEVSASTVSINNLSFTGGNSASFGGGIRATGSSTINLSNSVVSANSAYYGGGISADTASAVSLINSTVSGNSAAKYGGGILVLDSSLNLSDSTVSGNSAFYYGGGVYALQTSLSLSNSTISGNLADYGGGIFVFNSSTNLVNSTVSLNLADYSGGGILAKNNSVSLGNSIVAGNTAPDAAEIENFNNTTSFTADKANLFGDSSNTNEQAFSHFAPGVGDISSTYDGGNPTALSSIVSLLYDNGGSTKTHALVMDSPAINRGDPQLCKDKMILRDQRGERRDAWCDIGAYELMENTSFFIVPLRNGKTLTFEL